MKHLVTYQLFEKRLSRTMDHVMKDEYAVLTAWRSAKPTRENLRNMKALEGDLSTGHYGYIDMHGVGQEHDGPSVEKSLMVINHDKRPYFKEVMLDLAKKYEQDFILYGKDGTTHLLDTNTEESVDQFKNVKAGKAEFYSALRGLDKEDQAFHLE